MTVALSVEAGVVLPKGDERRYKNTTHGETAVPSCERGWAQWIRLVTISQSHLEPSESGDEVRHGLHNIPHR